MKNSSLFQIYIITYFLGNCSKIKRFIFFYACFSGKFGTRSLHIDPVLVELRTLQSQFSEPWLMAQSFVRFECT